MSEPTLSPQNAITPAILRAAAPVRQAADRTRDAIARGAQRTGTDFTYLLAQAKIESGYDPNARARTSSASGLFQFIDSTWLSTLGKHGAQHGLGQFASAIQMRGGRGVVSDPGMRAQIMALRYDPEIASTMAGALAQDNRDALRPVLGRDPDASELYLAHFLGAGGAGRFLSALNANPGASAAALMPDAASANRAIFYDHGVPRSLGQVMDVIRGKMAGAMGGAMEGSFGVPTGGYDAFQMAQAGWSSYAGQARTGGSTAPAPPAAPATPSMAETLRNSFGLGGRRADASGAADHVRAAYDKLQAFAL